MCQVFYVSIRNQIKMIRNFGVEGTVSNYEINWIKFRISHFIIFNRFLETTKIAPMTDQIVKKGLVRRLAIRM